MLVLNVHHRGSLGDPVPNIVRLVVLDSLARMLGLRKRVQDKHKEHCSTTETVGGIGKISY